MRYALTRQNDLFNDLFPGFFSDRWNTAAPAPTNFAAPVNLEETDTHYLMSVDAPGFRKEDIHVEVVDDVLKLKGERLETKDDRKKKVHVAERRFGRFERSFSFGELADLEKIEAQFADGVLHLAIPKKEAAKPRRIDVKVS